MSVKKKNIQFSVTIPSGLPEIAREEIGERIISHIITRTSRSKDKNNKSFPSYSKEYKQSADFKAVGKSSKVDLELSGDMLESLEIIKNSDGRLVIGYSLDDEVAGRVEGNVIGSYGKPFGNPQKARDFLGISSERLDIIIAEVTSEFIPDIDVDDLTKSEISKLFERFSIEDDDGEADIL